MSKSFYCNVSRKIKSGSFMRFTAVALAAATAELTANEFVAPYLFEVREVNGAIRPVKEREIIRAAGPTVHPHTGKQAKQVNA